MMTNEEGDQTKIKSPPDVTRGAHARLCSDQRAGPPWAQLVFMPERCVWASATLPTAAHAARGAGHEPRGAGRGGPAARHGGQGDFCRGSSKSKIQNLISYLQLGGAFLAHDARPG